MGRVEVNLDEDTHQAWRDHIEQDNRYKTMTQLIRFAVGEQIDRDNQDSDQSLDGDVDIDTEEITDAIIEPIQALADDVKSLENDVIQTQRILESQDDDEILNTAMELHDLVPKIDIDDSEKINPDDITEDAETRQIITNYKRNVNEAVTDEDIKIALARLENDVPQVKSMILNDSRIYYQV